MAERQASHHWVSTLDDIAWLLNLRGSDVPYNPVFLAHLLLAGDSATLFTGAGKVPEALARALLDDGVALAPYEDAGAALAFNRGDAFAVTGPIGGAGSVVKRGSGTMLLAAALSNAGPTLIEAGLVQIATQQVQALSHRWSFYNSLADSVGTNNATIVEVGPSNTTLAASSIRPSPAGTPTSIAVRMPQSSEALYPEASASAWRRDRCGRITVPSATPNRPSGNSISRSE